MLSSRDTRAISPGRIGSQAKFLEDSLRNSTICVTALGRNNVYWLTHIIQIESQKNGSHLHRESLNSIQHNLQEIIAYMQAQPTYKEEVATLNDSIRQYYLNKLHGKDDEKRRVKSEIFSWYQTLLSTVRRINLNARL